MGTNKRMISGCNIGFSRHHFEGNGAVTMSFDGPPKFSLRMCLEDAESLGEHLIRMVRNAEELIAKDGYRKGG